MTRTILVAGTASHVGKSTVVAGLCRLLADEGVDVVPFKAQNMSNNARAVPVATAEGAGEIGISQYVQARAARLLPTTDVNPVLLKPRGGGESQLVIHGKAVEHISATGYYDDHWARARAAARESFQRLSADHDVVVAEGAGSIAEINLHDRDLANVETARFTGADIILVADIDRGGAFASLVGTLELMPDDVAEQVAGAVVTKFRGDRSILAPGLEAFEDRTSVPVLGVIPHDDPGLPAEDSVSLPDPGESEIRGATDGVPEERSVTIAVPRLPRVSNFTDLAPLASEPGVRLAWVPLDDPLAGVDAVVLPGTKNTVDDLLALRDAGFDGRLEQFEGPVVGVCGGYQMLGEHIHGAAVESAAIERDTVEGFGLLPVETQFTPEKRVTRTTRELQAGGLLADSSGTVTGYEIHMGTTQPTAPVDRPFEGHGVVTDRILGTYLHGLFENDVVRDAFLAAVFESVGSARPVADGDRADPYDRAAALADHIDRAPLGI